MIRSLCKLKSTFVHLFAINLVVKIQDLLPYQRLYLPYKENIEKEKYLWDVEQSIIKQNGKINFFYV